MSALQITAPPSAAIACADPDLAERVTRRWLLRVLERVSVSNPERLPDHRLVAEAPRLVEVMIAALRDETSLDALAGGAPLRERLVEIAGLRGSAGERVSDSTLELGDLHAAIAVELRDLAAENGAPGDLAAAHERLTMIFAHLQAALVEEHLRGHSRHLELLASTDPLTGLFNVRVMRDRLEYLTQAQRRYRHPFSLLLIDLNGLKEINDRLGHASGDEALVALAEVLGEQTRGVDFAARIGGDEFCVLLPDTGRVGARSMALRIADAVRECELASGAELRVSIGAATAPEDAEESDRLLHLADSAMYEAKRAGAPLASTG